MSTMTTQILSTLLVACFVTSAAMAHKGIGWERPALKSIQLTLIPIAILLFLFIVIPHSMMKAEAERQALSQRISCLENELGLGDSSLLPNNDRINYIEQRLDMTGTVYPDERILRIKAVAALAIDICALASAAAMSDGEEAPPPRIHESWSYLHPALDCVEQHLGFSTAEQPDAKVRLRYLQYRVAVPSSLWFPQSDFSQRKAADPLLYIKSARDLPAALCVTPAQLEPFQRETTGEQDSA